jgi:hypothetical protein
MLTKDKLERIPIVGANMLVLCMHASRTFHLWIVLRFFIYKVGRISRSHLYLVGTLVSLSHQEVD